ncbi:MULTISPECIES: GNAT family N-acetyltransferase [unclassified Agarivorans]|uniref:GNAT family N-acetyltransferase n=1 Tax=unclassified Agarivorans TaxID=2636026 RepID=UPI003D7D7093
MSTEPSPNLVVRAISSIELYQFCELLMEAASWFESRGETLWKCHHITPHSMLASHRLDEMYMGYIAGKPVAAMILDKNSGIIDVGLEEKRESLFMHKLTVKREFAGQGIAKAMVDWARCSALKKGYTLLSLICNCQDQRLRWTLGQFGFEEIEILNPHYQLQRYFRLDLEHCKVPLDRPSVEGLSFDYSQLDCATSLMR